MRVLRQVHNPDENENELCDELCPGRIVVVPPPAARDELGEELGNQTFAAARSYERILDVSIADAVLTDDSDREQIVRHLLHLGELMSGLCFNLAQEEGQPIRAASARTMRASHRQWDAAMSRLARLREGHKGGA